MVPAAFSMLLKLRYKPDSNPTLSASFLIIYSRPNHQQINSLFQPNRSDLLSVVSGAAIRRLLQKVNPVAIAGED
jgi:hypothetical protein